MLPCRYTAVFHRLSPTGLLSYFQPRILSSLFCFTSMAPSSFCSTLADMAAAIISWVLNLVNPWTMFRSRTRKLWCALPGELDQGPALFYILCRRSRQHLHAQAEDTRKEKEKDERYCSLQAHSLQPCGATEYCREIQG